MQPHGSPAPWRDGTNHLGSKTARDNDCAERLPCTQYRWQEVCKVVSVASAPRSTRPYSLPHGVRDYVADLERAAPDKKAAIDGGSASFEEQEGGLGFRGVMSKS